MTHYEALGVGPSATPDEIRKAYVRQALLHHPDVGGRDKTMQTVNEAWAVLGDPDRRRAYDSALGLLPPRAATPPPPPPAPASDDDDDDDEAYGPPERRSARREAFVLLPAALLGLSVGTFALGTLMLSPALQGLAILLLAVAAVSFVLVPILTLRRQARRSYRN